MLGRLPRFIFTALAPVLFSARTTLSNWLPGEWGFKGISTVTFEIVDESGWAGGWDKGGWGGASLWSYNTSSVMRTSLFDETQLLLRLIGIYHCHSNSKILQNDRFSFSDPRSREDSEDRGFNSRVFSVYVRTQEQPLKLPAHLQALGPCARSRSPPAGPPERPCSAGCVDLQDEMDCGRGSYFPVKGHN